MLKNDERILRVMRDNGFDALLGSSIENVYYLSGGLTTIGQIITGTSPTFVLITKDDLSSPIFILEVRDLGPFFDAPFSENSRVRAFGNFHLAQPKRGVELTSLDGSIIELLQSAKPMEGPVDAIVEMIEGSGLSHAKVGVDEVGISWALLQDLERALPDALLTPASALFRNVRSVKTKEEIRRLRRAVAITETAILESMRFAREGVTEKTLARRLEMSTLKQGAHPLFTMISFGSRGAHALWPSDAALRRGDLIKYDVGCVYDGYKSDVARVAIRGKADDRVRRCFDAVRAGTDRVMELVKPGVRVGELFEAGVAAVQEAGIRSFERHGVGHGIGLEVYDDPILAAGDQTEIEAGMVLSIEVPYYEVGLGGFNLEDTVLVTDEGIEKLTTIDRELFELEL